MKLILLLSRLINDKGRKPYFSNLTKVGLRLDIFRYIIFKHVALIDSIEVSSLNGLDLHSGSEVYGKLNVCYNFLTNFTVSLDEN